MGQVGVRRFQSCFRFSFLSAAQAKMDNGSAEKVCGENEVCRRPFIILIYNLGLV